MDLVLKMVEKTDKMAQGESFTTKPENLTDPWGLTWWKEGENQRLQAVL